MSAWPPLAESRPCGEGQPTERDNHSAHVSALASKASQVNWCWVQYNWCEGRIPMIWHRQSLELKHVKSPRKRVKIEGLDGITQSIFPIMNTEIWCRGHCIESRLWISWISTTCGRLCFLWQLQHHFPWDFTISAGTATLSTGSPMRSDSLSVTRNVSTLEYFQQPAKIKRNSLCSQLTNPLILFSFPFISCFQWPSTGWVVELKTKTVRSFNIPNELNSSGSAALETSPLKRKKMVNEFFRTFQFQSKYHKCVQGVHCPPICKA